MPTKCDVLVVGAGPAGSACAHSLARHGRSVLLVDQHAFPRDKVCGDALIPDAHAALARLGVGEAVAAAALRIDHVACVGPRGGRIEVPGRLAVLPRRTLDWILLRAAEAAGVQFEAPWHFESLRQDGPRVVGASLRGADGQLHDVTARWVVLATGAVPQALIAAGVCHRRQPSGVALRAYVRHPALAQRIRGLEIVWHRELRPGYGWIFPGPDSVFNIGVGIAYGGGGPGGRRRNAGEPNLRRIFDRFCAHHGAAAELMNGGEMIGELKGAPLRCSLEGSQWSAPGLLVTGEAAGSTYSFTGEGIGKALETGLLAAEALLTEPADVAEDAISPATTAAQTQATLAHYDASLAALRPRFALYERANQVNAHPWLTDLLIWRAQRSPGLVRRMSGVLDESRNPGSLITLRGMIKLFMPLH